MRQTGGATKQTEFNCDCIHKKMCWSHGYKFLQVDCLEWVLSHGGSVLDRDSLGGTLVHDAAEQGQVMLVP